MWCEKLESLMRLIQAGVVRLDKCLILISPTQADTAWHLIVVMTTSPGDCGRWVRSLQAKKTRAGSLPSIYVMWLATGTAW